MQNVSREQTCLYHFELGFPKNLNFEFGKISLNYSSHALHAANTDRYGTINLPTVLDTAKAKIIEIEVIGEEVIKAVYRIPHCRDFSLIIVVMPYTGTVKTVWLNRKTDNHKTLNRSKYTKPKRN